MSHCTCRMETGGTFDEQLWIQCDHCRELDERDEQTGNARFFDGFQEVEA